jgi:hypothetical protein
MKVKSKIFKGIEYVQLSDLPPEQRELLSKTINSDVLIKIMVGGKIQHDCIQFKDYTIWFDNVFRSTDQKRKSEMKEVSKAEIKNLVS